MISHVKPIVSYWTCGGIYCMSCSCCPCNNSYETGLLTPTIAHTHTCTHTYTQTHNHPHTHTHTHKYPSGRRANTSQRHAANVKRIGRMVGHQNTSIEQVCCTQPCSRLKIRFGSFEWSEANFGLCSCTYMYLLLLLHPEREAACCVAQRRIKFHHFHVSRAGAVFCVDADQTHARHSALPLSAAT